MPTSEIRFDDGSAYERFMGKWSRLAGETFLDWLAPRAGLRWLDVGCGNGAFTEMIASMSSADLAILQSRMRARLPSAAAGQVTVGARANAVKGRTTA